MCAKNHISCIYCVNYKLIEEKERCSGLDYPKLLYILPVVIFSSRTDLFNLEPEASAIQSFPDNFEFTGSEGDAYRQIGNAIPPIVMWHIARSIAALIDE